MTDFSSDQVKAVLTDDHKIRRLEGHHATRLMPVFENAETDWNNANHQMLTSCGCSSKT
jgi:hypothetical protein